MADYTPWTATEAQPEAPATALHFRRWFENWEAGFEGAPNAPRLRGEAVARFNNGLPVLTVSASDAYSVELGIDAVFGSLSTTSTSEQVACTLTVRWYTGSIRFRANTALRTVATLYKNNVLVATFGASTAAASDVAVVPGDVLQWRIRIDNVGGSPTASISNIRQGASDAYVDQPVYRRATQ